MIEVVCKEIVGSSPMKSKVISVHADDNVAVVVYDEGLKAGMDAGENLVASEDIPHGQKIALTDIELNHDIVRYGEIIGRAKKSIKRGGWLDEACIQLPVPPDLSEIPIATRAINLPPLQKTYSFKGYRNNDGSAGTKNILAVMTSVQCVAGFADQIARKITTELLPKYPNVDAVVPINHAYGCGVAIDAPHAEIPIRSLQNLMANPNFGNESLIIGLGCEKLQPQILISANPSLKNDLVSLQDCAGGFEEMVKRSLALAEQKLRRLNERTRQECPVSDLVVGVQCGGSDALSGVTANPVVGFVTDMIVRAGGTVLFSEVSEVRDAIHLLTPRAINEETGLALIREMQWYDSYLEKGGVDRSANPTPGNKEGGISNIVEKSLGSIAKSGTGPIADVLSHGEKVRRKGLVFAATPASDFVCGTQQLASGINLQIFTTGRGTPYNLAIAPVIKVSSQTALKNRWPDLIDLDAGQVVSCQRSIEDVGMELFELVLRVAGGETVTAAEKLQLFNDLAVFNPAPIT